MEFIGTPSYRLVSAIRYIRLTIRTHLDYNLFWLGTLSLKTRSALCVFVKSQPFLFAICYPRINFKANHENQTIFN